MDLRVTFSDQGHSGTTWCGAKWYLLGRVESTATSQWVMSTVSLVNGILCIAFQTPVLYTWAFQTRVATELWIPRRVSPRTQCYNGICSYLLLVLWVSCFIYC